jgi:hypothetical protein
MFIGLSVFFEAGRLPTRRETKIGPVTGAIIALSRSAYDKPAIE